MNKAFKATLVLQQQQVIARVKYCDRLVAAAAPKFPDFQFMEGLKGFGICQAVRSSCNLWHLGPFLDTLNPFSIS